MFEYLLVALYEIILSECATYTRKYPLKRKRFLCYSTGIIVNASLSTQW